MTNRMKSTVAKMQELHSVSGDTAVYNRALDRAKANYLSRPSRSFSDYIDSEIEVIRNERS